MVSNWDFATENAPKLVEKIIFHSENDKSNLMIAKANPLVRFFFLFILNLLYNYKILYLDCTINGRINWFSYENSKIKQ